MVSALPAVRGLLALLLLAPALGHPWHEGRHAQGGVHGYARTFLSSRRVSSWGLGKDGRMHEHVQEVRDEVASNGLEAQRARAAVHCIDGICVEERTPLMQAELVPARSAPEPAALEEVDGDIDPRVDAEAAAATQRAAPNLPDLPGLPDFGFGDALDGGSLSTALRKAFDRAEAAFDGALAPLDRLERELPRNASEATSVRSVVYSRGPDGIVRVNSTETRCVNGNCTTVSHSGPLAANQTGSHKAVSVAAANAEPAAQAQRRHRRQQEPQEM